MVELATMVVLALRVSEKLTPVASVPVLVMVAVYVMVEPGKTLVALLILSVKEAVIAGVAGAAGPVAAKVEEGVACTNPFWDLFFCCSAGETTSLAELDALDSPEASSVAREIRMTIKAIALRDTKLA